MTEHPEIDRATPDMVGEQREPHSHLFNTLFRVVLGQFAILKLWNSITVSCGAILPQVSFDLTCGETGC